MHPRTLAAFTLIAGIGTAWCGIIVKVARADIVITTDHGGSYRDYVARVDQARFSGERVVIDGPCESACTLYLSLPANQICATARGSFAFHAATSPAQGPLPALPHAETTLKVWQAYPPAVQIAIGQRGGLWTDVLRFPARRFVRACK